MHRARARFSVGDVIQHRLFDYRGVIVDVDPVFAGDDEWYEQVARSRPPKDAPWYHVLVSESTHTTCVAERNLLADDSGREARHPLLGEFFDEFRDGRYLRRRALN